MACLGAVWGGEHDGVHGLPEGVASGGLSPARVAPLLRGVCDRWGRPISVGLPLFLLAGPDRAAAGSPVRVQAC
jgi:hypothetical protein